MKLAAMMGIEAEIINPGEYTNLSELSSRLHLERYKVIAIDSGTAATFRQTLQSDSGQPLLDGFDAALIYGFENEGDEVAAWLSNAALSMGKIPSNAKFSFNKTALARQMAGLSFSARGPYRHFQLRDQAKIPSLIDVDGQPFFVETLMGGCRTFLLPHAGVIDVDAAAREDQPLEYVNLLPWLMFLRAAFGEYCWDNYQPRAAFTIDDPLLTPSYGFVSYAALLEQACAHNFAATFAFIPWNYRRSSPSVTRLFQEHRERLSLCVHGCDHTGGEFRGADEPTLRARARIALDRIEAFEAQTGVACARIMIFPQGQFSKAALRAVKHEDYLATVNTSAVATDASPGEVRVRDLLNVAVTCYGGAPLYNRRYPRAIFPSAVDLYLGKPALLVEHHGYFKHGYGEIRNFVGGLNALQNPPVWQPLNQVIRASTLCRRVGVSNAEVRVFTDEAVFRNPYEHATSFRFVKSIEPGDTIVAVKRDGARVDYQRRERRVECEFELASGSAATLHVRHGHSARAPVAPPGLGYRTKVAMRRYLSEFRDNYVARSDLLLGLSRIATRRLFR
ncbi:MAG: hypothetical protein ACREQX_17330 [Candidatus Binataceae bacterium]